MRTIKKVFYDVFVDCAIIFMQAVGKGLIKFSKHYRNRSKVSKHLLSPDNHKTINNLGLKRKMR
jgi:hypothetical protein